MKKKSISAKLFRVYVLFFSIFISLLLLVFGLYVGVDINNKIIETQEQMLQSINKNINNFFEDMNDFSMTLVNSRQFKEIAIEALPKAYEQGDISSSYFRDMYLIAYKMIEKGYKVGIYTNNGYYIWLGNNYFITKSSIGSEMYRNYSVNGYMNIHLITENKFLEEYLYTHPNYGISTEPTVSLARTVNRNNIFNKPEAMLEIHVPYEELDDLMKAFISNKGTEDMNVLLYDKKGEALYSEASIDLSQYRVHGELKQGEYREQGNIINIIPVPSTELYMVSIIPYAKLYSGLNKYIVIAIAAFLFVNITLMFITYKISYTITTPIKEICDQIKNMDFYMDSKNKYQMIHTDIHEIDILNTTIEHMQSKLFNSLEEIVQLQAFEIQSKMLALQSQMQPHFLYNTLTTISVLSEEQENEKVARVCNALTHMLRYISSESNDSVTIADEIEYVDKYVHIMQERFENTSVHYNVPLDMIDLLVPKLIIQPLVENSFKYSEQSKCDITINGYMKDNKWGIEVLDNGKGFQPEDKWQILKRCEEIWQNYRTASLTINGMGLPNIYSRLKLLYGEDMYFDISNNQEGGGCVRIGGRIKRYDDA